MVHFINVHQLHSFKKFSFIEMYYKQVFSLKEVLITTYFILKSGIALIKANVKNKVYLSLLEPGQSDKQIVVINIFQLR